jgi:hypothetical protein
MSRWTERILGYFTADLTRLWVTCDPDTVLLDEKVLYSLRARGFEVMRYEDPFSFRAEFEERYRIAWDGDGPGATPSLVLHVRGADQNVVPWDIISGARMVKLSLAELFPRLAYSVVKQVEAEHLAALFEAHETELQGSRGENESKDFILEHVYQLIARSVRTQVDFWRELLRMHFANRGLPSLFAAHAAGILQAKGLFTDQPISTWLCSKSAALRVVQDAWYRYLEGHGLKGSRIAEPQPSTCVPRVDIPFDNSDIQALIDSMFLNGTLQPLIAQSLPATLPTWIKTGVVQDPDALQRLVLQSIEKLVQSVPNKSAPYKEWGEFAQQYGEILARAHSASVNDNGAPPAVLEALRNLHTLSDERLQTWIMEKHYADLMLQPVVKGPVMVHHIPRFLRRRRASGDAKVALLVFDGLALDQWVQVRESLIGGITRFAFDEGTSFALLPTVTSVSRQALFSGLKPREFEDSIDRTDKEEFLWKTFWQNEGLNPNEVMYRRALRHVDQLDALAADLIDRRPSVLGMVIDEVDNRIHKERSKKDVSLWIRNWLGSGFVDRLFSILLDLGYSVYLTADHGNVEATGVGRPRQGVIAETRGERVRVYRSETLLADSAAEYPSTVRLNVAGLPTNFMPLFAGGRTAFVPVGEQVVVHGGVSVEELIVPFVKVMYATATE